MAKLSKAERRAKKQARKFLRNNGESVKKMPREARTSKKILPLTIHGELWDIG